MKITKSQLREIIREEIQKLNEMSWSSPEAKTQVDSDVKTIFITVNK